MNFGVNSVSRDNCPVAAQVAANQLLTETPNFDWLRISTVAQPNSPINHAARDDNSAMWHDIATHEIAQSFNHENKPHEINHNVIPNKICFYYCKSQMKFVIFRILFRGSSFRDNSRALQPLFANSAQFMMCHCIKR